MKRSKTVAEKIHELYALMAAAAAQRAVNLAKEGIGENGTLQAEFWAETTGRWLDKSSAQAANWTYTKPRLQT